MSRFDGDRLEDITAAIHAIRSHMLRGDLDDALVLDAVRVRLIEIGEAVKALSAELTETEPEIPWRQVRACGTISRTATSQPRLRSSARPSPQTSASWKRQSSA